MDPFDPRLRTYRSKDGSMERTLLPEMAALIYPDWIEVSEEQARRRDDALELDSDGGAICGSDGELNRPADGAFGENENKENE